VPRELTAVLHLEFGSEDGFKTTDMAVHPWIEYSLGNLGLLYLEYKVSLPAMKKPVHTLGIGMEIKAF
jgi:hypothetical protein